MGRSKNLMIAQYPTDFEMPDDFLEWSQQFDDFMKNRQADEPVIHQPALVKNHNLLIEF
jgi:hypothetical protein